MRRTSKLASRIALSSAVFAVVSCLILTAAFNYVLRVHLVLSAQTELAEIARTAAQELNRPAVLPAVARARVMSRSMKSELLIVDSRGLVIGSTSSRFTPGQSVDFQLLERPNMSALERARMHDKEYVYAVARIPRSNPNGSYVVALTELTELRSIRAGIMSLFVPLLILLTFLSLMLAAYWSRHISKPLHKLQLAAQNIAQGNYTAVPNLSRTDEIGELAASLKVMALQLKIADQSQRQFIQNASHELKTPLMNIQGYTEALRDGIYDEYEADHCLEIIEREIAGMRNIIDDMIYLSLVTGRTERYSDEEINLADLLRAAEESSKGMVLERNLRLQVHCQENIFFRGDFDKLVRALTNLISNAVRYADSSIVIGTQARDGSLYLEVMDDGPGLKADLIGRVFDRLTKGDDGQTGLGLAIAKAIVEAHGGDIKVRNESGAVFTIRLPL